MIIRMHARWRRFRKLFSRSEWMVRLLGLPKEPTEAGAATHGLVMIQIDGLSHIELQHAIKEGEMPFVARLLERENYAVRKMYSGLPSNTPSMQAELFYGVPSAVPAFGFFHKGCGRMCRMLEPESAREVEAGLAQQGEPLLRDGSAYSDIYTGGAREPRWCAASMGWGTSTKAPGPFLLLVLALMNVYGLLRAAAFGVLEIGLATFDAIRGIFGGSKPKHEFKFIPARVGVCVLLREWITHAARMDIVRGLPIIHLNLLGYDEQSHHRGPDSAFAHWVLGGIDDSIKRVWRAAKNSDRRSYEVWIYSDHGQVRSTPYLEATGKTLKETVAQLWKERGETSGETVTEVTAPHGRRALWKGAHGAMKVPPPSPVKFPMISDFGPLALVYLGPEATDERRTNLGTRLAQEGGVPVVIDARGLEASEGRIGGWTEAGPFSFPEDADKILAGHPFREAVMRDLERVARHEHAGDLILLGWKSGIERPLTFAFEYGAHGGISPEECTAFVAMPEDLERESLAPGFMRPADLRRAALFYMGRTEAEGQTPDPGSATAAMSVPASRLRVMTYNVHSCIGLDQRADVRRIARMIAHYHPDVVCLQELDVGHARSGGLHQARQIASLLRFEYHFHSVREVQDQQFGNAILSRYPLEVVKVGGLPGRGSEARGALWVEVEVAGHRVQILNTHLGLGAEERALQVKAILGPEWLGAREAGVPMVVCGDLNCGPGSPAYRLLSTDFADCQLQVPRHKARNTWFSNWPLRRLDHIFVSDPLVTRHIHIPTFQLAKVASDHLPLVADIALPERESQLMGSEQAENKKRESEHV